MKSEIQYQTTQSGFKEKVLNLFKKNWINFLIIGVLLIWMVIYHYSEFLVTILTMITMSVFWYIIYRISLKSRDYKNKSGKLKKMMADTYIMILYFIVIWSLFDIFKPYIYGSK